MRQHNAARRDCDDQDALFFEDGIPDEQAFADTEEERVKTMLAHRIATAIESAALTQAAAAQKLNLAQSDVSRIVNLRFDDYSVWRLMKVAAAMGCDVHINVGPPIEEAGAIFIELIELPSSGLEIAPTSGFAP